jgi:ABC-2 type transport system permease protein
VRRFSIPRVGALALRHLYVLRRSPIRILELFYWPFMNMLLWGFIAVYLRDAGLGLAQAAGLFLGAVVLWEILIRSNMGMTISFVEELYARNLGHLFVSPLRPTELAAACVLVSALRTMAGVLPSALLMPVLFDYSVFSIGLPLAAFYLLLSMFGWAFGMVIMAILIRWGLAAEGFAWASMFVFMPIAGVYYPIDALPTWLQPVSWALPTAYVFEGMRAVVLEGTVRMDYMAGALALNLLYLAGGVVLFLRMFRVARTQGLLLNTGQ